MTGPGTNSYLIGERKLALVDPGPNIDAHIDALLCAVGDRLEWVCVTHTHMDHSPAAAVIAEQTGAMLVGNVLSDDGYQDVSFVSQRQLVHEECITSDEFTLRALLTPGHVANHICYLLEDDHMLITGDHIMSGSTVVIIPPAGDMKDYIQSLRTMLSYPLQYLAPGHGDMITEPQQEIEGLIAHRLAREAKVLQCMHELESYNLDQLVLSVYVDVDTDLHELAKKSLLAHLIKLQRERRVREVDGFWQRVS